MTPAKVVPAVTPKGKHTSGKRSLSSTKKFKGRLPTTPDDPLITCPKSSKQLPTGICSSRDFTDDLCLSS